MFMKCKKKVILSLMVCASIIIFNLYVCNTAKGANNLDIDDYTGIKLEYRTIDEIRNYINKNGAKVNDPIIYNKKPSVKPPYSMGTLSDETLDSAIKMINQIRFIAGLNYNVTLNNDYINKTQAASLVNSVNDTLTHNPDKPSMMDDNLYEMAYKGASSSNISCGYSSINSSIINGYMNDGDSSNIDRVGHRRWILNPKMSATGFGAVGKYSAMYSFDNGNYKAEEYGVLWPAMNMPIDYFAPSYPWSISMGYNVNMRDIEINLIRLRDNKNWKFNYKKSDGYFNVNNQGYGEKGCIIFRPDGIDEFLDGDLFQVSVTGLDKPLSYNVKFFDLIVPKSIKISGDTKKMKIGSSLYLKVDSNPSKISSDSFKWKTSNKKIASVDKYGVVYGVGYGTVKITATHINTGIKATYTINVIPNKINIKTYKSLKKNQTTITYKKDKKASGYEILYATNKNFTKNKKVKSIKNAETIKANINGLKSDQTYYIKVRAIYKKNGDKICGSYGGAVRIKVR